MSMGLGTLTALDSFDSLMGKRRGVSQGHEVERRLQRKKDTWALLWDEGLSEGVVQMLSEIDALTTPDELRGILLERLRAMSMASFATDWKQSLDFLSEDLGAAVQDAVLAYWEETSQSSLSKLQDTSNLIDNFFLDESDACLTGHEMKSYQPLIEAISRIHREEALPDDDQGSTILRMARRKIVFCLNTYAGAFLHYLSGWRDGLAENIAAGLCDNDLNTLRVMLQNEGKAIDAVRRDFLKPLNEAADARLQVLGRWPTELN